MHLPIAQSDGVMFSVEIYSSQMNLAFVKLTNILSKQGLVCSRQLTVAWTPAPLFSVTQVLRLRTHTITPTKLPLVFFLGHPLTLSTLKACAFSPILQRKKLRPRERGKQFAPNHTSG